MPWTFHEDVTSAWIGQDKPDDLALITTWIGKAERLIRSEIPGIQARIDSALEPDLMSNAVDVVVEMVIRKFRNPEGLRQVQEASGPFSGSRTYGGTEPGSLYMTEDDLKKLLPAAAATGQKAFSVSMIPGGDY